MKRLSWALLVVFALIPRQLLRAQTPTKVVPPSPNAASLGKYGDIPVSNYTGVANISIPLYDIKAKTITVPLSISYHASGIRVSDEASQVGLGWSLNANGLIARTVIGKDDFLAGSYFDTTIPELPYEPSKGSLNKYSWYGCTEGFGITYNGYYNGQTTKTVDFSGAMVNPDSHDFQPDQYSFNFLNYSGKFTLNRNKEVILAKQEKIQIKCLDLTNWTKWEVKTADGFTYLFDVYETYRDTDGTTSGSDDGPHKTAWYLTKITSPTNEEVNFYYTNDDTRKIKPVGSYSETMENQAVVLLGTGGNPGLRGYQGTPVPGKYYSNVTLSYITFSQGRVDFTYSTDRLDVQGDKKLTTVTVSDASGLPIKKIDFGYDYFVGQPFGNGFPTDATLEQTQKRLKLVSLTESVTKNGATIYQNPYLFNYYQDGEFNTLPLKNSFARDHWGYFNGKANASLIPAYQTSQTGLPVAIPQPLGGQVSNEDMKKLVSYLTGAMGQNRNADKAYTQAFSLKEIVYPLKGRTELQYETHDFDLAASKVRDFSFMGSLPIPTIAESLTIPTYDASVQPKGVEKRYPLDLSNEYVDPNTGLTVGVKFDIKVRFSTYPSVSPGNFCQSMMSQMNNPQKTIYVKIYPVGSTQATTTVSLMELPVCNGGSSPCTTYAFPFIRYQGTWSLPRGNYEFAVLDNSPASMATTSCASQYSPAQSVTMTLQDVLASFSWTSVETGQPYAGGLRISKLIDHDGLNEANNRVKKFIYTYQADKNLDQVPEDYSYGRRMTNPQYTHFDLVTDNTNQYGSMQLIMTRSSDSHIPLNGSASGSVVGYDRVTVLNGETGEFGKTEYFYKNLPDLILDYGLYRPPVASNIPSESNGLLTAQIDYVKVNGTFSKVREVNNDYSAALNVGGLYGIEVRPDRIIPSATTGCGKDLIIYPAIQSTWVYLSSTREKIYDQNDAANTKGAETTTTYTYETIPSHYQVKQTSRSTSESDKTLITEYTYPIDYASVSSGVIALMKGEKHMHSLPIETVTKVQRGSQVSVTGATFTVYEDVDGSSTNTTSIIQPTGTKSLAVKSPLGNFVASVSTGTAADGRYEPKQALRYHPSTGNLRDVQPTDGMTTAYLWSYQASLPIAEVRNASEENVAHTSFESGTSEGGWTYAKQPVIGTAGNLGKTGRRYYTLATTADQLTRVTGAGTYLLSYWARGSAVTVTGGTITDQAAASEPDANGWVLYRKKVVLSASATVAIAGSGSLDEVRLHPLLAQMTTYTYDPLVGVTSSTDASNVTTYYEYDGLQRLQCVKDQDGNLVKHYLYHYRGQQP